MEEKKDRHQSLIRPFTLISTRENGIDEVRRLLEIVYNLFLEVWMSGVYFFGELCHSFCPWHIKRHIEPIRKFIRLLESWYFCLLITEANWREMRGRGTRV